MNKTKKILVIDHDKLVCKIIKVFLENTGKYKVMYATDVAKGIVTATSRRVELILCDDRVQTDDGLNLADHMLSSMNKQIPLLPTGVVIDRAKLKMQHIELNTIFNTSMLDRIDALVKQPRHH